MKTKLTYLSTLRGKLGNLAAQMRRSGSSISRKSIPYSTTGEARSAAQEDVHARYRAVEVLWHAASQAERDAWDVIGAGMQISGWNYLVKITMPIVVSRYGTAKYGTGKYS